MIIRSQSNVAGRLYSRILVFLEGAHSDNIERILDDVQTAYDKKLLSGRDYALMFEMLEDFI